MKTFRKLSALLTILISLTAIWFASTHAAPPSGPSYQIVELANVGAQFEYFPREINNSGLVVGNASDAISDEYYAVCWQVNKTGSTINSTLYFLQGGANSAAVSVNVHGAIVGITSAGPGYWANRTAVPVILPVPAGSNWVEATHINDQGVICGFAESLDNSGNRVFSAVAWKINVIEQVVSVYGPVTLPTINPTNSTGAFAVSENNTSGVATVVGAWQDVTDVADDIPLSWLVTSNQDGSLTVSASPTVIAPSGFAWGLNNSPVICGEVWPEAVVWTGGVEKELDRSATISVFGGKRKTSMAVANRISTNGVIVGRANFNGGFTKAVVWPTANSPMLVLDKFIKTAPFGELSWARSVNDDGYIIGNGWHSERHANAGFLAVPK